MHLDTKGGNPMHGNAPTDAVPGPVEGGPPGGLALGRVGPLQLGDAARLLFLLRELELLEIDFAVGSSPTFYPNRSHQCVVESKLGSEVFVAKHADPNAGFAVVKFTIANSHLFHVCPRS